MAKSTYSGADSCVDIEIGAEFVKVEDSNDPAGPALHFAHNEWRAFILGVKAGEFDLPDGGA